MTPGATAPEPPPSGSLDEGESPAPAPDLRTLREEIARNPHAVPASLTRFAREVGARIERARESKEATLSLFSALEECAAAPEAPSLAAYCAVNAVRVARFRPAELRPRIEDLRKRISPAARSLIRAASTAD